MRGRGKGTEERGLDEVELEPRKASPKAGSGFWLPTCPLRSDGQSIESTENCKAHGPQANTRRPAQSSPVQSHRLSPVQRRLVLPLISLPVCQSVSLPLQVPRYSTWVHWPSTRLLHQYDLGT